MNKIKYLILSLLIGYASSTHAKPVSTLSLEELQRTVSSLITKTLENITNKAAKLEEIKALHTLNDSNSNNNSLETIELVLNRVATIVDEQLKTCNIHSYLSLIIAEDNSHHFYDYPNIYYNGQVSVSGRSIPSIHGQYKTAKIYLSELENKGIHLTLDEKIGFISYNLQVLKENKENTKNLVPVTPVTLGTLQKIKNSIFNKENAMTVKNGAQLAAMYSTLMLIAGIGITTGEKLAKAFIIPEIDAYLNATQK